MNNKFEIILRLSSACFDLINLPSRFAYLLEGGAVIKISGILKRQRFMIF